MNKPVADITRIYSAVNFFVI